MREVIRSFEQVILGYVDTDGSGNKIVSNFSGVIVGRYEKADNCTKDFYGRILGWGDFAVATLFKKF